MNELIEELKSVLAKHNAHIEAGAEERFEDGDWLGVLYVYREGEHFECPLGMLWPDRNDNLTRQAKMS
jgi:hypothetical protein